MTCRAADQFAPGRRLGERGEPDGGDDADQRALPPRLGLAVGRATVNEAPRGAEQGDDEDHAPGLHRPQLLPDSRQIASYLNSW
jgi:hypothetical protein